MKISKRTQYGLRAMVYLAIASGKKKKICSLKEISEKENISFDYLEKIISQLEKKGLLKSKRGAQGGYFLASPPKKIKVSEIIKVLEGTIAPVRCVAKEKKEKYNCPRKRRCKTFNVWQKIQDVLNSTLNSITLADLIKK
jgi:Rrf2 family cysteine metabolism transcriptional repressor